MIKLSKKGAKPFLKWAGGKGQLIEEIRKHLPREIVVSGHIEKYFEPFLGGGAVFFWLSHHFTIQKSYLYDINPEIIAVYQTIKTKLNKFIAELKKLQKEYYRLDDETEREEFYYERRSEYNKFISESLENNNVRRTALIIFLNKTCFNGLFRVNSQGHFNVPFGRYENPKICDEDNLKAVSVALRNAEIKCRDFEECLKKSDSKSLIYFDPPYRPISPTSNFTGYIRNGFSDDDQKRLKKVCDELKQKGAKVILSNSDPKNVNPDDNFFDHLYQKGYRISRVPAARMINSNANKRGEINELLVTSY